MSSLQKFHRRTNGAAAAGPLFPTVGSGSDTIGYRLGYASGSSAYLIVAPKSTEVTGGASSVWGSSGTVRGTTSTTNGVANTNTLAGFGQAAHPAAYYCKSLTTGGYNTWYMPAKDEFMTLYSNKSATPFATANSFLNNEYISSTEQNATSIGTIYMANGGQYAGRDKAYVGYGIRPVRQYYAPATIGDGSATTGYWLGTAGDGVSKLIAAPKSTEVQRTWGSVTGLARGTTSTTNGVDNTTTLYGFGSAAHPAAYYAKALSTGGYNSWYLPAKDELITMYSNKSATPFATADAFVGGSYYWSSTETNADYAWGLRLSSNAPFTDGYKSNGGGSIRAIRRSTI
jgi:hypothetical protein